MNSIFYLFTGFTNPKTLARKAYEKIVGPTDGPVPRHFRFIRKPNSIVIDDLWTNASYELMGKEIRNIEFVPHYKSRFRDNRWGTIWIVTDSSFPNAKLIEGLTEDQYTDFLLALPNA